MPKASLPSPSFLTILRGGEERKHLREWERKEGGGKHLRLKRHGPARSCQIMTHPTTQLLLNRNYKLVH